LGRHRVSAAPLNGERAVQVGVVPSGSMKLIELGALLVSLYETPVKVTTCPPVRV